MTSLTCVDGQHEPRQRRVERAREARQQRQRAGADAAVPIGRGDEEGAHEELAMRAHEVAGADAAVQYEEADRRAAAQNRDQMLARAALRRAEACRRGRPTRSAGRGSGASASTRSRSVGPTSASATSPDAIPRRGRRRRGRGRPTRDLRAYLRPASALGLWAERKKPDVR